MFRNLLVTVLLFISFAVSAQDNKDTFVYNYSFDVNSDVKVVFDNHYCNLDVKTSETDKIKFTLNIIVDGDPDDVAKVDNFLKNRKYNATKELVELSSSVYKSLQGTIIPSVYTSIKVVLPNGDKVKLSKLDVSATLLIPAKAVFKISSHGSNISMDNLESLNFNSDNDKVIAKSVKGNTVIDASYSKFSFDNLENLSLNLFDSDIVAAKANDIDCKSKYSEIDIPEIANIDINGFDDKYIFNKAADVNLTTKYSNFKSNETKNITINSYDSDVEVVSSALLSITSTKYSTYKFGSATSVNITKSFDDKVNINNATNVVTGESKYTSYVFKSINNYSETNAFDNNYSIDKVNSFRLNNTKYSDIDIENITEAFFVNGFEDNTDIANTSPTFKEFTVKGKYQKVKVTIPESLSANIDYKSQYGKCSVPSNKFTLKSESGDTGKQHFVYAKSGNNPAQFTLDGFTINLNILTK